jgi:hypothetical protein
VAGAKLSEPRPAHHLGDVVAARSQDLQGLFVSARGDRGDAASDAVAEPELQHLLGGVDALSLSQQRIGQRRQRPTRLLAQQIGLRQTVLEENDRVGVPARLGELNSGHAGGQTVPLRG